MLRSTLVSFRRLIARAFAKLLPWDGKLDHIESRLDRLEALLERTHAHVNRTLPDRAFVEQMFVNSHGYIPDLDAPRTFNEKIAWTKLNRHEPIYAELSDKVRSKPYVRELLGGDFVIESLAEYESTNQLDFARLPSRFILKPSHGSGWTIIVRDKASADLTAIKTTLHRWMTSNYYLLHREPQYRSLVPRLIVEPLLLDAAGNLPADYKLHCFHGRVAFIQVDTNRHKHHRCNFYDRNWTPQPFEFSRARPDGSPLYPRGDNIDRPRKLAELIQIAEKLATPFDHVRVDLYLVDDRTYFGEMTFSHAGAGALFFPRKWDRIWGDLWHLNKR